MLALVSCIQISHQQNWNPNPVNKWDQQQIRAQNQLENATHKLEPSKKQFFPIGPIIPVQPIVAAPIVAPVVAPQVVPNKVVAPFAIQQPVLSYTGEVIVENTIGGISFDCRFRPTGHWRDNQFCDVFHACVHGYQRKTYSCPIVGERTYFDEVTQRCEFVHLNPQVCASFSV